MYKPLYGITVIGSPTKTVDPLHMLKPYTYIHTYIIIYIIYYIGTRMSFLAHIFNRGYSGECVVVCVCVCR